MHIAIIHLFILVIISLYDGISFSWAVYWMKHTYNYIFLILLWLDASRERERALFFFLYLCRHERNTIHVKFLKTTSFAIVFKWFFYDRTNTKILLLHKSQYSIEATYFFRCKDFRQLFYPKLRYVKTNKKQKNKNNSHFTILTGCGFVGRHLVTYFINNGLVSHIRVVDKTPPLLAWLNNQHMTAFNAPLNFTVPI